MRIVWIGFAIVGLAGPALAETTESPYSIYGQATGFFRYGSRDLSLTYGTGTTDFTIGIEAHHRFVLKDFEARLDHRIDLSPGVTSLLPATIQQTIDEGFGLFHFGDQLDFFIGQKRQTIGLASTFALGDVLNPRSGYWDQRTGFRGAGLRLSIGDKVGLVAAASAERILANPTTQTNPVLAGGFDLQLDKLNLAGGYTWSQDYTSLPTLGLSWDFGGLIVSAETAVELTPQNRYPSGSASPAKSSDPLASFAVGARWNFAPDRLDLTLAVDYAYLGQGYDKAQMDDWAALSPGVVNPAAKPGLLPRPLRNRHYLLPSLSFTITDALSLKGNALINLQDGSSLVAVAFDILTFANADLELKFTSWLGNSGDEFRQAPVAGQIIDNDRAVFEAGFRMHF